MLQFTYRQGNQLHYTISGRLHRAELQRYYAVVAQQHARFGKLHLTATVHGFRGYGGWRALTVFLRQEPSLPTKLASYTVRADQAWLRIVIRCLGVLVPWVKVRVTKLP